MRRTYALVLLLCAHAAAALEPAPVQVAQYVDAASIYGRDGAALVDLDGDGKLELAMIVEYDDALSNFPTYVLEVRDPRDGYGVLDARVQGTPVRALLPVAEPSGAAHSVLTLDSSSTVRIYSGIPLQEVARFDGAETLYGATYAAVGNVAGDGPPELVYCNDSNRLLTVDLGNGLRRDLEHPCQGLALLQFDDTPRLEIFVNYGQPQVYDGDSGMLLSTAPHALHDKATPANLDADPQSELITLDLDGTGLIRVDPANGWAETVLDPDFNPPWFDGPFIPVDANHDGIDEVIALAGSTNIRLYSPGTGEVGQPLSAEDLYYCYYSVLVGDVAGTGQLEGICTGEAGAYAGVFATQETTWRQGKRIYSPARPAFGDVDGDGQPEVVEALFGATFGQETGKTSTIAILDPDILAPRSRTVLAVGTQGQHGHAIVATTAADSPAPARAIVLGGISDSAVPGAGGSWLARVAPADPVPMWTTNFGDNRTFRALVALDLDGDGKDEIAGLANAQVVGFVDSCVVRVVSLSDGAPLWTADASAAASGIEVGLIAAQVDGTGAPDLIAACGDSVRAMRGEDGAELWTKSARATDMHLRDEAGSTELLLSTQQGVERRKLDDGTLLGTLPGKTYALADIGRLDDVLTRAGNGIKRIDATTDVARGQTALLGLAWPWLAGLVEVPAPEGYVDVLAEVAFGVVRMRTEAGALFRDGFE